MIVTRVRTNRTGLAAMFKPFYDSINRELAMAEHVARRRYRSNTAKPGGRFIKSNRVYKAYRSKIQQIRPGASMSSPSRRSGEVKVWVGGRRYTRWMASAMEEGKRITPKKSQVLTIPNRKAGYVDTPANKIRARRYRNAFWVPGRGGDRSRPLLIDPTRPKGRKVIMFGRRSVRLKKRPFFRDTAHWTFERMKKRFPGKIMPRIGWGNG